MNASPAAPARLDSVRGKERDAIIRAAYRLVGRGRTDLAVQEILAEAGISTRAFYRHFDSKDALVLTMFETAASRFHADLQAVVDAAPGPVEALEALVRRHLAVSYDARSARQAVALSMPEVRAVEGYRAAEQRARRVRIDMLTSVLRCGVEEGVFTALPDPEFGARAVLGALGALMDERLGGGAVPGWDECVRSMMELFLRAFGHVKPTRRRRTR